MFASKDPVLLKATGNAALYLSLSTRQPTFLRRNWMTVLDIHESTVTEDPTIVTSTTMSERSKRKRRDSARQPAQLSRLETWCETDPKILHNFLNVHHDTRHRPPRIEISSLIVRRQGTIEQIATPAATPAEDPQDDHDEPDWLEPESKGVLCMGTVSGTSGFVRTQAFTGHLILRDEQWHLQLDHPLLVDVMIHYRASRNQSSELKKHRHSLLVMERHEPVTMHISLFTTEVVLTTLNSQAQHNPIFKAIDLQDDREARMFKSLGAGAVYLDTDEIKLFPTMSASHTKQLDSGLEIEASCRWHTDSSSGLEKFYKRVTTSKLQPAVKTAVNEPKEVMYIFQGATQITISSMTCPLCGFDCKYFKRLQFHLSISHDHFKAEVQDYDKDSSTRVVHLDLSDAKINKPNIHDNDELQLHWVAPSRSFDIDAHIQGDKSWTGEKASQTRNKSKTKRPQPRTPQEPSKHRLPPEEVPELRDRVKAVHPVPQVSDAKGPITFYRTNSKRVFAPGEMIENSDDECGDDSWIQERRRQHLDKQVDKNQCTKGAAQFMADWDAHIDVEVKHGASGDRLMRESAIRFARQCKDRSSDTEYLRAWTAAIFRKQKWNIFDQADVDYCLRLIPPL